MRIRPLSLLLVLMAACLASACQRIEPTGPTAPPLSFQETVDGVPLAYGRFVAVSQAGLGPGVVALWFEADDRTLTSVRVNTSTGQVSRQTIVVRRN